MRRLVVVVALTGCTFSPQQADPDPKDPPPTKPNPDPTPKGTCHITDPELRLCLDFEDKAIEPIARDGSTFGHDASTQSVTTMPHDREQAMHLQPSSGAFAPVDFAATPMSYELFVSPDAAPTHDEYVISTATYGVFRDHDGTVACDFGGNTVWSPKPIAVGAWTHVGCVADDTLRIYVNGDVVDCTDLSQSQVLGGDDLLIGNSPDGMQDFVGGVDNIRVFSRALSADDMCARAGRSQCKSSCPQGSPGDH